jgi:hypothetical protein
MPIVLAAGPSPRAIFSGPCGPDEADALLEWLRATPDAAADLGACESLHTALAQLLMAAGVCLAPPPPDALLAECLVAAGCRLQAARAPGPPSEITGSESPRKRARGKRAGAETAMGGPA